MLSRSLNNIEHSWTSVTAFKCPNTIDNIYAKYKTSFRGCPRSCPTMTNLYMHLYMARYHFLAHAHYTIVIKFDFLGMAICLYNLCMLQARLGYLYGHTCSLLLWPLFSLATTMPLCFPAWKMDGGEITLEYWHIIYKSIRSIIKKSLLETMKKKIIEGIDYWGDEPLNLTVRYQQYGHLLITCIL